MNANETRFFEQLTKLFIKAMKSTDAEMRQFSIISSRHWSLRIRLPYLFRHFASDLWYIPFKRTDASEGLFIVWNIGSILISDDIPHLVEYLRSFLEA